jgi:hypothetical protein
MVRVDQRAQVPTVDISCSDRCRGDRPAAEGLRTAIAVALTPVSAFALGRVPFLTAVNGHAPTRQGAEAIVREVRERDSRRRPDGDAGDWE